MTVTRAEPTVAEIREALDGVETPTGGGGGATLLIPLLQKTQKAFGYIPEDAIYTIAERSGVSASEVFGVLTFYAQFRLTPQGEHVIHVCQKNFI